MVQMDTDQSSNLNTLEDASNGLESDIINPYTYQMTEKIKELKEQLEKQYSQLTVTEYNYKRAIFEYLTLLNSNNRYGQMDISLEIAQKIFINASKYEKHQKTVRVIDDEDVAEKCHVWI
ncbi:unnamed protein product [Rhizophagus irregularis]|uniref:Uncharacterized protein n=1 Tax=Rhizophagus irregularis TaxID=588596 RepID=A0A2I1HM14_9GLOM|nr:hypothetical protein RhiirA4_483034 [Rhizophagus irregularis]CAB4446638.1 unnamed protein product [Rhizophagus irregularis]